MRERKTKTEHDDIQMSMALTYETGGSDCCDWVFCVAKQSTSKPLHDTFYLRETEIRVSNSVTSFDCGSHKDIFL